MTNQIIKINKKIVDPNAKKLIKQLFNKTKTKKEINESYYILYFDQYNTYQNFINNLSVIIIKITIINKIYDYCFFVLNLSKEDTFDFFDNFFILFNNFVNSSLYIENLCLYSYYKYNKSLNVDEYLKYNTFSLKEDVETILASDSNVLKILNFNKNDDQINVKKIAEKIKDNTANLKIVELRIFKFNKKIYLMSEKNELLNLNILEKEYKVLTDELFEFGKIDDFSYIKALIIAFGISKIILYSTLDDKTKSELIECCKSEKTKISFSEEKYPGEVH